MRENAKGRVKSQMFLWYRKEIMNDAIQTEIVGNFKIEIFRDDEPWSSREWDNLGTMVCFSKQYKLGDEQPDSDPEQWLIDFACDLDSGLYDTIEWWDNDGYRKLMTTLKNKLIAKFGSEELLIHDDMETIAKQAKAISDEYIRKAIDGVFKTHIAVMLPLTVYDHGNLAMSAGDESYEGNQDGWIYVTKEKVRKEYGWKNLTKKCIETIEGYLRGEVEVYDRFLSGRVYGHVVTEHGVCRHCGAEIEADIDSCWGHYIDYDDLLEEVKQDVQGYKSELGKCECCRYKSLLKALMLENELFAPQLPGSVEAMAGRLDERMGGL